MTESIKPSFPPDADTIPPPGSQAAAQVPLPLPVRGTRYAVGGILVAIILTVVTTTYLRIEQQLQQTLERQLGAVLDENAYGIERWLDTRDSLARSAAKLPDVRSIAASFERGELNEGEAAKRMEEALSSLIETGVASSVAFLPVERKAPVFVAGPTSAWKVPIDRSHWLSWIEENEGSGRVLSLARIGPVNQELGHLILGIEAEEMTRGLTAAERRGTGETYAFNESGFILGSAKTKEQRRRYLPGDTEPPFELDGTPQVKDYMGRGGKPVVGAFTWLSKYRVGVATEVLQSEAYGSIARLRQSFLVLVTLVGAAVLGLIALGRWTLRVREESLLMTRRLGRLARAIQPLSAALENDPSAVVLADADGHVVYANAASHRVLGVSAPLYGRDVDAVFENLPAELQAALDSGRDSIVAQGAGSDDETLLVSSRNLTIDGNPHALFMLRPVTQQVRRQEVEHWKKLIRVLSHELNNALAPITSLLSSARKVNQMSHQDPRLGQIFENIAERTEHLISFIEGYREVARLPRPDQRETRWSDFLASLESQKRFRLVGDIPQRPGYFDPSQLERVLINVLNNAIEADSDPDEIVVEVIDEKNGFLVNVMDRGNGMPEPVLKQAMLPFFSTKRTGTGVGLALSREIIEAHGGQLTLANREGGGLVVSCFLPDPTVPAARTSVSRLPTASRNVDETST